MIKIAVIQFPGSNSDAESLGAVREAGMEAEEFLWNRDPRELKKFDGYFIIGGFSYEDRSRSGIIASLDPLMPYIAKEAVKGKPVLGVCNGAQILVETGLVPGLKGNQVGMALATNKRVAKKGNVVGTGYYNAWVNVKLAIPVASSAFSRHLTPSQILRIPVAHGEGRFVIPKKLLKEMIAKKLTIFRYCDDRGKISAEYPTNPNGAVYNLAAVTNLAGNIMAIMPHPERTQNGQPIFTSMRDYIAEHQSTRLPSPQRRGTEGEVSLAFSPPPAVIKPYKLGAHAIELIVNLIITDNEAATVQTTLAALGIKATISRSTHWEISFSNAKQAAALKKTIVNSGELFNANKEKLMQPPSPQGRGTEGEGSLAYLLVRYRDDFAGQFTKEALVSRLGLKGVKSVKRGTLWKISSPHGKIKTTLDQILDTHILFNQFSQECFKM